MIRVNCLKSIRNHIFWVTVLNLLMLQTLINAEENINTLPSDKQSIVETKNEKNNVIDSTRLSIGTKVGSIARIIDSFFGNPDYVTEEADGRISLHQSMEISRKSSRKYHTSVKGALSLPSLSRRLKLTFKGNDNLDIDDTKEQDIEESAVESIEAPSIGLQYSLFRRHDVDIRQSTGVRFRNFSLYTGFRFRLQNQVGRLWHARFTQSLRWYTNDGWRSNTKITFDRIIGTRSLFRQTFSTAWSEDRNISEGFRYTINSSFTQPLGNKTAIRYHWSSVYFTRPEAGWSSSTLYVKYRQRLWRDWVILEFAPFVLWEDSFDWKVNPGASISITLIFEEEKLTPKPCFN